MPSRGAVESRPELAPKVSQLAWLRAVRHRQATVVRGALAGVVIAVVLGSVIPSPAPARTIRWTLGVNQACGVDV